MAVSHSFRGAMNGFNRKDVVQYIEFLNSKHTAQVNQLTEEADQLRKELEELKAIPAAEDLSAEVAALESAQQELTRERDAALAEAEQLKQTVAELTAQLEKAKEAVEHPDWAARELEAYRRAERAERAANERAEQICRSAIATLAQATTQVDNAAGQFNKIAVQVSSQMNQLQAAVELGKSALMDAATTMYSIRSEHTEV